MIFAESFRPAFASFLISVISFFSRRSRPVRSRSISRIDFFIERKTHAPGEGLPAFYAVYGFGGCVFLVLAAKYLRKLVMRDTDYWDPEEKKD